MGEKDVETQKGGKDVKILKKGEMQKKMGEKVKCIKKEEIFGNTKEWGGM